MHSTVRRFCEVAVTALQVLVPKSDVVVIHGTPVTEGNAVEMASALSRRYQGRIVWLVDDNPECWTLDRSQTSVAFISKWTIKAFYYYLRCEVLFYTHGLYGAIEPSKRQTFINLWHGDGVKRKPTAEAARHSCCQLRTFQAERNS